ncbi:MAG: 30S ribosomal protein S5 [Vampirovibrionales bacterium]|nr:30S ribosomal protein S5 [Vampirovibrionales bacterium]
MQAQGVNFTGAAGDAAGQEEWKERTIQVRRVTKVVKGGKKMSFRAVVVIGNGNGIVGLGVGKAGEVATAVQKAITEAKKELVTVPIHKKTIPHVVKSKACGSQILIRPASEGTGVIAGGAARAVFELAGIHNILCKSLGSNSPLNVARAAINSLKDLRSFDDIAASRGMSTRQMLMVAAQ